MCAHYNIARSPGITMPRPIYAFLILLALAGSARAEPAAFDLEQYQGKVVYLDFWASWCKPCRQSFPWMDAMQKKYATQGLVVVAVDVDEVPAEGEAFLKLLPAGFTVVHDPKGELAARYQLIGMPSSFLIGRDGKVIEAHKGFYEDSPAKYEAGIQAALAAP
jgi:cytochrome c biogenesis protein CcmG/thiol:disulfide interchange protein DsbE